MAADERSEPSDEGLSRRRFLGQASAVGGAFVASRLVLPTPSSAVSEGVTLSAKERQMVLEVARAGARVPIEFPDFGEPGPAVGRATLPRLREAERRVDRARLALV